MSKAREPTFIEMYGKDAKLDGEGVAISVSKTIGFIPTGELKKVNCWEGVEKKVLQRLLPGEQRKISPTTECLCFVDVVVSKAKWYDYYFG